MIEEACVLAAVLGTGIAAYSDWKTSYMPDEVSYAMMAIGAVLMLFRFPFEQAAINYGIAGAIFLAGLAFYFFGQLGGGDVKLFTGLALLLPGYPAAINALLGTSPAFAPYPPIISVFFASTVMAMLFVSASYSYRLVRDRKKIKKFSTKAAKGGLLALAMVPLFYIWYLININMLVIAVPMVLAAFLLSFKEDILRLYIVMWKPVSKLNDDDVLAIELMGERQKRLLGIGSQKTLWAAKLKEIKSKARKHGIKKVLVSEYLPRFGPFILAALLLFLLLGDPLMWLLFV